MTAVGDEIVKHPDSGGGGAYWEGETANSKQTLGSEIKRRKKHFKNWNTCYVNVTRCEESVYICDFLFALVKTTTTTENLYFLRRK